MSKFLFLLLSGVFLLWFSSFDADAYHQEQQVRQQGQADTTAEDQPPLPSSTPPELLFPLKGKSLKDVISGFGDPRDRGSRQHQGIDIPAPKGTPVLAVTDGEIIRVARQTNAGKYIWLKSEGRKYFYAHLNDWLVKKGQKVKQGDPIGTVGNTGNASHTLPHLHFEVQTKDGSTMDPAKVF